MRKAELERALQAVPDFPAPRADLEQYPTPAAIATDLLLAARDEGDLAGTVLDLGCGTGVLSLGAALLGADVTGIDIDADAIAIARSATERLPRPPRFEVMDVADWDDPMDAAICNPPFGAQKKGADRPFFQAAKRAVAAGGGAFWFLAQPKTERFLAAHARELGAELELVLTWPYPIEARFDFHDRAVRSIQVGGYRMGW